MQDSVTKGAKVTSMETHVFFSSGPILLTLSFPFSQTLVITQYPASGRHFPLVSSFNWHLMAIFLPSLTTHIFTFFPSFHQSFRLLSSIQFRIPSPNTFQPNHSPRTTVKPPLQPNLKHIFPSLVTTQVPTNPQTAHLSLAKAITHHYPPPLFQPYPPILQHSPVLFWPLTNPFFAHPATSPR